jgi:hypothetical protein
MAFLVIIGVIIFALRFGIYGASGKVSGQKQLVASSVLGIAVVASAAHMLPLVSTFISGETADGTPNGLRDIATSAGIVGLVIFVLHFVRKNIK